MTTSRTANREKQWMTGGQNVDAVNKECGKGSGRAAWSYRTLTDQRPVEERKGRRVAGPRWNSWKRNILSSMQ